MSERNGRVPKVRAAVAGLGCDEVREGLTWRAA